VRHLSYLILEALQKENPLLAAEAALRMEEQEIKTLVPTHSSQQLFALAQRGKEPGPATPAPGWVDDMKLSRRVLRQNRTESRVEGAMNIKDEALRDYTLAAMIAHELDAADTMGREVLKDPALPPALAQSLRQWFAIQP